MRHKVLLFGLVLVLLAGAAWARAPHKAQPMSARHAVDRRTTSEATGSILLTGRSGTITAFDEADQEVLFRARHGVVSPTGELAFGRHGRLVTIVNTTTGRRVGRVRAPEGMSLEVVSADGGSAAFSSAGTTDESQWLPPGRHRTSITIVRTNSDRRRTYDLRGNFGIEGFSTDGRQLFLLEYMPAMNPWHYGLRRLVLKSGDIQEIKREKQNAPGQMNGTGKLALFSPAGDELYTLYTQQGPNYTHVDPEDVDEKDHDAIYAFVHLLNLDGAWTHCIDLPPPFGTGDVTTHAMAVSADGSRLYVADPSSGGVAVIDPEAAVVLNSATVDLEALRTDASASVSPDGNLYLAGHHKVLVLDGDSLELLRTFRVRPAITGIAMGNDGRSLYAGVRGGVLILDLRSSKVIERVRIPAVTEVVGRV